LFRESQHLLEEFNVLEKALWSAVDILSQDIPSPATDSHAFERHAAGVVLAQLEPVVLKLDEEGLVLSTIFCPLDSNLLAAHPERQDQDEEQVNLELGVESGTQDDHHTTHDNQSSDELVHGDKEIEEDNSGMSGTRRSTRQSKVQPDYSGSQLSSLKQSSTKSNRNKATKLRTGNVPAKSPSAESQQILRLQQELQQTREQLRVAQEAIRQSNRSGQPLATVSGNVLQVASHTASLAPRLTANWHTQRVQASEFAHSSNTNNHSS
jgi:hypothetical protein